MAPRETENNAYAKFWGDRQRALWYVMVFLEWSIGDWVQGVKQQESRKKKKDFEFLLFPTSVQKTAHKLISPCME